MPPDEPCEGTNKVDQNSKIKAAEYWATVIFSMIDGGVNGNSDSLVVSVIDYQSRNQEFKSALWQNFAVRFVKLLPSFGLCPSPFLENASVIQGLISLILLCLLNVLFNFLSHTISLNVL